jgi:hypothetical protein
MRNKPPAQDGSKRRFSVAPGFSSPVHKLLDLKAERKHIGMPGKARRTQVAARLVLCAFVIAATGNTFSRRTPNRLLPAPGSIGTTLNLRVGPFFGPTAPGTIDHPLFHSSYMGEPNRVVAHTAYGDINAQDFYLWLLMREGPHQAFLLESYDKARLPADREAIAKAIRAEIDEYVFTNYIIPKVMGNSPCDGVAAVKERIYALPAYQLAYIKDILEPVLCVLPADRVKYLREHQAEIVPPERFHTRYIFRASNEGDPLEQQDAVEDEMRQLRDDIVTGKVSFSEAARRHSEAQSAARGGEIPPFKSGELFYFYEEAASSLKPGEVSNVFRGPRGYYMVQLIEALPPAEASLDDPVQARKVDEALTRQILREAYNWDMRSMLARNRRPRYYQGQWDQLEDCDPVAEICGFDVTKQELRDAFPEIEGDDLRLRTGLIDTWLKTIIERSAMAAEVLDLGKSNDPMLGRAHWMAANLVRRDGFVDRLRCGLEINESLVQKFWADNPRLFTPMAVKRLIRVTMLPLNTAPLPSQIRDELQRVLVQAGDGAPTVPVVPDKLQPEEVDRTSRVVSESLQQTEQVFQALENDAPTTSEPQSEVLPQVQPAQQPVNAGIMIPGLQPLPSPGEVTSGTLAELRGGGISETAQGGGCIPLSQGVVPPVYNDNPLPGLVDDESTTELLPARNVTRPSGRFDKVYAAPESARQVEMAGENWHSPMVMPPLPVACKPVPLSTRADVIPPNLVQQRAPNENKQLAPPATSNYPFNPDWFFARIDITALKRVVQSYKSSDFLMRYDDLGYVYVEDVKGAPPGVEAVPVGAFSKPYIDRNTAVSYYVEDARRPEKPPFEAIKTQAYSTYTDVQTDKALQRAFREKLASADITYTFESQVKSSRTETISEK